MEIKYQVFDSENLVVQKFIGLFSYECYTKFIQEISRYYSIKAIHKVLIDFRSLEFEKTHYDVPEDFSITIERVTQFRKQINQKELKNENIKLVMWVDEPLPTLVAHLFIRNFSNKNYNHCFTADEIIEALELPEHLSNLEEIVNNLENTFQE